MKQYILSNASDNMSLFGRIDIAFFHFIWMSTFLRISSFISNGMGFEGNLVILIAISFILLLMLFWILPLNLLAYFTTRHQDCLMSILIYVGWLASLFIESGLSDMLPEWYKCKGLLWLLCLRVIILLFMVFNNKSTYIFGVKIILCILLYLCAMYSHVFFLVRDCCLSIVYVFYALCRKNGWSRSCNHIISLYVIAMLIISIISWRISGLFQ
jgi:hypothetical protein